MPEILRPGVVLREVAPGILSALPEGTASHPYDAKAAIYDLVVARRLYCRLIWGANRDDFIAFEQLAVGEARDGWMLDAGCGSLVFTHRIFANYSGEPIVLVDRSVGMLERARLRLLGRTGELPSNLVLLQADLLDLPFREGVFATISCPGLLHLFADPDPLIASLCTTLAEAGAMYWTSLVTRPDRRLAAWYLRLLERRGEVARPRTFAEVALLVSQHAALSAGYGTQRGNMAYFANRLFWDAETIGDRAARV